MTSPDVVEARRLLLVFDGAAWFIRRVAAIEHDLTRNMKVYHCDEHLGGPFSLSKGCRELKRLADRSVKTDGSKEGKNNG